MVAPSSIALDKPRKAHISHPLDPADEYLLAEWADFLRAKGWKPSSVQRALNRLRAFARVAKAGLCGAEKEDVAAFADQRCKATGVTVATLLPSDNWRETVRTLRAFFRWTHGRWSGVNSDPTVGILSPPTRSRGPRIKAADGRLYERVLAAPEISCRDRAILFVMALGLIPADVAGLPVHAVNIGSRYLLVSSGRRVVPVTKKAVEHLNEWLARRQFSADQSLFLGLSASAIRAVFRRAAYAAFPDPSQGALRRRLYPLGLRHLFILRAVQARVAPDCLRQLTGIDRFSRVLLYATTLSSFDRVSRELGRMTARRPGWI
jgi:site-specific recombinase XerC